MTTDKNLYVGIDIGYEYALISVYSSGASDVETISTIPGKDNYQIPLSIFQTENGNYYYGSEAVKREHREDGNYYGNIYEEALKEQHGDLYKRLLVIYLRRLLRLTDQTNMDTFHLYVTITVPEISSITAQLMNYVQSELGIPKSHFMVIDYAESFYAYVYHQDRSIWIHDTALFDYDGDHVSFYILHKGGNGRIQKITCRQTSRTIPAYETTGDREKDRFFAGIISEHLNRQIVSSVYFTGNGFDGGWLKESITAVGSNKRIFLGKNLFTKGACLAFYAEQEQSDWLYYYDAPYKFKGEVRMKVSHQGKPAYVPLVEAGKSWFQGFQDYRVLYDGDPKLEFQIRTTENLSTTTQYFELTDLPSRPDRTIRFRIKVEAFDGYHATILIEDDGFGEIYPSSGKSWKYDIAF